MEGLKVGFIDGMTEEVGDFKGPFVVTAE